ncbi:hypothetical protein HHI36_023351 [Cryptolaemus montrouzieri]|uniref:VWFA and cache domain-containing protein 1 n=1 Tax=Cryptolaemus montrouzieri TaxID=559131 RepID=A0ABD2PGL3_9CUCU
MFPNKVHFRTFRKLSIFLSFFCLTRFVFSNENETTDSNELLKPVIENFRNEFELIKNEELQVPLINNLYSKPPSKHIDPQKKVEELSEKLNLNINIIYRALEKTKQTFKIQNGSNITKHRQSFILPCKDASNSDIFSKNGDSLTNHSSKHAVKQVLNNLFYELWNVKSFLKQVFLLSLTDAPPFEDPYLTTKCSGSDHSLLWKIYMSHNTYRTRRVILLIDHGNSIEDNVLALSKVFAKQMITVLTENDKFTVIAIASKWSSLSVTESCGNQHLPSILAATDNNKELTFSFIDALAAKSEITDHNMGMKIAMKMARLFYAGDETVMLLYISPGMQFSMSEAMEIVAVSDLSSPLIINTCTVSLGTLPDIQDMNILSNIMNDFFLEKNRSKNQLISQGRLIFINEEYAVGPAVARFYEIFNNKPQQSTKKSSLPTWDPISKDLSVAFSIGFSFGNRFIVIGAEVFFTNFVRDIIYYSNYQKDMYAILMNHEGKVLVHPSIPLERHEKQMKFAHISKFFHKDSLWANFFKKSTGTVSTTSVKYNWQNISDIYVICFVVKQIQHIPTNPSKTNWLPNLANGQLVSYLLDLAGVSTSCRYFGKLVNIESPSLYLSQSCFQHVLPRANESTTMKLLPYLQYENLLKQGGLQDGIRDELIGLMQVIELLRKKHVSSINSNYIIRRYIATKSGILHVFPGVVIDSDFKPSKRSWFIRADELRGKTVVSPPYLDTGGAGYIVTISFATPNVVLGIDVTYGYVFKLILDQYSDCINNSTCFFVDDRGYLISHPDLIKSLESDSEPIEQLHLVHKESSVANDFLNHEELVQKLACNDYTTATIQRYYQLNMSYHGIFNSSVLGEPCVSYSITPINHTNLFFGVVKAACPIARTFCPCSVIDRLCLNCQYIEKQECECPCECPISRSTCTNYTSHDDYELCGSLLESYSSEPRFNDDILEEIDQCPIPNCESKANYLSCLGVLGCEWCRKDNYGFALEVPFCTMMHSCFNGVLGGPSPYKEGNIETTPIFSSIKTTGVVLGLIIIFGVLFIIMLICWRSYNTPRNQNVYLSARQEEQLNMSELNINDDFLEHGNHSDKLLIDEKKGAPISPYCVTTNYSRPATAADSDHGYSTMTPHDESEHLSLAPIEIDSLEEDMASDRATPPLKHTCKGPLTRIPHRNCIIVPVTVHRHVDAT